jgi:hypothetical protein
MKSILQEANSIERAIDKAWNEAGKPKEFTIRVLDEGERNFLGLSRRPAIVSIFYKPEKVTTQQHRRDKSEEKPQQDSYRDRQKSRRENSPQQSSGRSDVGGYVREEGSDRSRRYAGTEQQRASFQQQKAVEGWTDEWKTFVLHEIRELVKLMGMTPVAEAQITGDKLLTITFKHAILDNDDDQRMLFATFSYLGMQLLKRMYKSRFVGYRVVVTGPKADGSAMSADSEEQIQDTPEMRANNQRGSHNRRNQSSDNGNRSGGGREGRESREGREGNNRRNNDRKPRAHGDRPERGDNAPRIVMHNPEQAMLNHTPADDIAADQLKFAQEQLAQSSKTSVQQPLKKDKKYQPFFVLEDEESQK